MSLRRENGNNNVTTDLVQRSIVFGAGCIPPGSSTIMNTQLPGGGLYTEIQLQEGGQAALGHSASKCRDLLTATGRFPVLALWQDVFSPWLQQTRHGTTYWRPELCATFQGMFLKWSIANNNQQ